MKARQMQRGKALSALLWSLWVLVLGAVSANAAEMKFQREEIRIPLRDGLFLKGEVLVPEQSSLQDQRAAVLFLNPFGQTFSVYDPQAEAFAKQGYVIVRYNPRGWHGSEGVNTLDYDQLTADAQDVLTWMMSTYGIAEKRVGVTGISEGAGLALLLASVEPRLGAVGALSAWTDFAHPSLGNTQRSTWSGILLGFLVAFGKPIDLVKDLLAQLKESPEGTSWKDLQKKISPIYRLAQINALGTPILLSHNYDDTLFPVNQIIDFYQGLTAKKRLTVFPGFHAASEITSIRTQEEGPWHEVRDWFAAHLQDSLRGSREGILFSVKNKPQALSEGSLLPDDLVMKRFYVQKQEGRIRLEQEAFDGEAMQLRGMPFHGGNVHTGTPVWSALQNLQSRKTVAINLDRIRQPRALLALSEPFVEDSYVFGIPRFRLGFRSSDRGLLIAHLVDVAPDGKAQLMTHGVMTWTQAAPDGRVEIPMEALGVAWHLKAGHRLGLVFDTFDAEYAPPSLKAFPINFEGKKAEIILDLPLMAAGGRSSCGGENTACR